MVTKNSITYQLKNLFGNYYLSYAILLIAVLLKTALYFHFFQFEGDKLFQALAARNLIEGHGLTNQYVLASDLSTEIFEPLNRWPPGYSLLIGALYFFSGDLIISSLIIDVFSIVIFFIILRKLLKQLKFDEYLINLLIIFNSVLITVYLSKPTDLFAVAALLYSCFVSLVFFNNPKRSPQYGLLIGMVNVLPVMLRYMYLPSVFIIPALLMWTGSVKKDNRLKMGGAYSLLITFVLLICLFLFQKLYTGGAFYIIPSNHGFYWWNLLMMYPAILSAFLNLNFLQQQLSIITGFTYASLSQWARYLNVLLFISLLIKFSFYIVRRRFSSLSGWQFFTFSAGLINVCILGMLFYLSLTNSPDLRFPYSGLRWTFIEDGRFFIFLITVLPIFAARYLFMSSENEPPVYKKVLRSLFILFLLLETSHTVYFLLRRFNPIGLEGGNVLITAPVQEFLKRRIRESKESNLDVILAGSDETISNWGILMREKGLLKSIELNYQTIKANKNSIVFVLIEQNKLVYFKQFLNRSNVVPEKQINQLSIFSYKVEVDE